MTMRLLHISDLHVGLPFQQNVANAVLAAATELKPHAIAVSGDIVDFGASESAWRRARHFLDSFGLPIAIAPGNHDIARFHLLQRLLAPLRGFRRHIRSALDAALTVPGATLVALATPKRWTFELGYLHARQLEFARSEFAQADPGAARIVVMHHGLRQLGHSLRRNTVRGLGRAIRDFQDMRVDMVLTGHNHFPHSDWVGTERPLLWCQAGTATTRRFRHGKLQTQSISLYTITPSALQVCWYHHQNGQFVREQTQSLARQAAPA